MMFSQHFKTMSHLKRKRKYINSSHCAFGAEDDDDDSKDTCLVRNC